MGRYLLLVEFTYKNGQYESLRMSPYEAWYGRSCRTPVNWDNPVKKVVLGPELLKEMEQEVAKIRQNLKEVGTDRKYMLISIGWDRVQCWDHV